MAFPSDIIVSIFSFGTSWVTMFLDCPFSFFQFLCIYISAFFSCAITHIIGGSRTAFFSIAYISPWLYCAYFLHFTCIRFMVSIFLSFNIIITFNLEKVLIYLHMNLLTLLHFILKLCRLHLKRFFGMLVLNNMNL